MAKFSQHAIDEIKSRLSIYDVVSSYVNLTRKGNRYWGCCPLHGEKTPSFTVIEDEGRFYCFGCHEGGSMFDFLMKIDHITFPEAVEKLARQAGVELKEETESEKKARSLEESLLSLYQSLSSSFRYLLKTADEAKHARDYLEQRHVSAVIAERFSLGYAPRDPHWLYDFLSKKGFSAQMLEQSGLFSQNNKTYTLFSDRIMFPIRTWDSRTVGFTARDLSGTSKAKYINTPETVIYSKKHNIFGINEALGAIKSEKRAIICEGNFDVLALHQAGLGCAVAPLGTAFTIEQAKLLSRYAEKILVLFDSDKAGTEATRKALCLLQSMGISNAVIRLQGGKDASEILEKNGEKALFEAGSRTMDAFVYLVQEAINKYTQNVNQAYAKYLIFKEVKPYLDATQHSIERQGYIKALAESLGVSEQQITEDYLKAQASIPVSDKNKSDEPQAPVILDPLSLSTDLYIMLILVYDKDLFRKARNRIGIETFTDPYAKELYTVLEDAQRKDIDSFELMMQNIQSPELKSLVYSEMTKRLLGAVDPETELEKGLMTLRLRDLEAKRSRMAKLIAHSSQEAMSIDDIDDLLREKLSMDKEIESLKKEIFQKGKQEND